MSALDPSAPGLPLAGGVGGGASLPTTPTLALLDAGAPDTLVGLDGSGVGATIAPSASGSAVLTGTASEGRAALGTGADPMTGAAWTDTAPAGTSVTWAGGVLTVSIDAGTTGGPSTINASGNTSPEWWDVLARCAVTSGNGESNGNVGLFAGLDAANCFIWVFYANGSYKIGRFSGGVYADLVGRTVADQISSGQRTGGQMWLRLSRSPMGIAASWGVGSAGAAPASWTTVYSAASDTTLANLSSGSWVQISPNAESALGSVLTWEVYAIQSRSPMGWT